MNAGIWRRGEAGPRRGRVAAARARRPGLFGRLLRITPEAPPE